MPDTLFFVHDDQAVADEIARPYRERGWHVEVSAAEAPDAVDRVFTSGTLAAIFFLDGTPDGTARALARALFTDGRTPHPLVVFVNGSPEVNEELRAEMPAALFVRLDEIPWVLKHLSFKA